MPTRILYTPRPSSDISHLTVFEYIAFVRIQVESSYMGFNRDVDPTIERSAILAKPVWLKGDWNPGPVNSTRDLSFVALRKLSAYLNLHVKSTAESSAEFAQQLATRYPDAYAIQSGTVLNQQRLAVVRIETGITENSGDYWGYRIVSNGDPAIDLNKYVSTPGRMDQFQIFLQAAARLDILKKLELLRQS